MSNYTHNMDARAIIGKIESVSSYSTITDRISECVKGYINTNEYFMHNVATTEADTLYIETDTLKCKIGNGVLSYSEIEYINITPSEFVKFVSTVNERFIK